MMGGGGVLRRKCLFSFFFFFVYVRPRRYRRNIQIKSFKANDAIRRRVLDPTRPNQSSDVENVSIKNNKS